MATRTPAADDAALVRASQRGDREAFGVLVSRHAPSILSLTTRMLGPTADAEDVAQETFVAAYKALAALSVRLEVLDLALPDCREQVHRLAEGAAPDCLARRADDESASCLGDRGRRDAAWELEQAELAWELDKGSRRCRTSTASRSCSAHRRSGLRRDERHPWRAPRHAEDARLQGAHAALCQSLAHLQGA